MTMHIGRMLCNAVAAVVLVAATAVAQDPVPPRDSLAADSLRAAADTQSTTDKLLEVEGQVRVQLTTMPDVGRSGLLPVGARRVFTRDGIDWAPAQTVSDLLAGIPGVFLWRAGWLGRAEMPTMQARGATSVEYLLDGLPMLAVGPDSLAVDPSGMALGLLDRVEVERTPGMLRVHLFTRRYDRQAPRTSIAVSTGDRSLARYAGSFERRYTNGLGLGLAADYFSVNAPPGGTGGSEATNAWVQLGWMRNARSGIQAQMMVQALDRRVLLDDNTGDTLDVGLLGTRRDAQLRAFWSRRDDGLGPRVDLFAARTDWSSDTVTHQVGTLGAIGQWRAPRWSAELQALHHTEWTPVDARLRLGWAPRTSVTLSLEGVAQEHDHERRSRYYTARAGVQVPKGSRIPFIGFRVPVGMAIGAVARSGERVQAPSLSDLEATRFTDLEANVALDLGALNVEGRYTRNDAWQPLPFRPFSTIKGLGEVPETEWLGVQARLAVNSWFTLASAYEHPMKGALPDGQPPHHAWSTATVDSRFLRNFPSGIFRLKVQAVVESWSPGVIGRDAEGAAIQTPGLSFIRGILQLQIGPFIAFWDRANFQLVDGGNIPRYPVLGLGSSYGIRWQFSN